MGLLPRKFLLFITPVLLFFIVLFAVELALPIDFFSFRAWEALIIKKLPRITLGPFYPNQKIIREEVGDLGAHTEFAVKKMLTYETDRFGYRYDNVSSTKYDIVVLGDSFIAGTSLDQKDMYTSVLSVIIKKSAYPLAAANINAAVNDQRLKVNPPKILIITAVEKTISVLPDIMEEKSIKKKLKIEFEKLLFTNKTVASFMFAIDRLNKLSVINYIHTRLSPFYGQPNGFPVNGILFYRAYREVRDANEKNYSHSLSVIKKYNDYFKHLGIPVVFLFIPDKESVYYRMLGEKRPTFLGRLNNDLGKNNIPVIDVDTIFQEAYEKNGATLYQRDDSHWSALGARLAAQSTAEYLKKYFFKNLE